MRRELLDEGSVKLDPNRGSLDMGTDEDSQPLNEMNQAIASRRNLNRLGLLKKINAALHRLNNCPDDFGYCGECDDPLTLKRLELMPYVELCVKCQSGQEDPLRSRRKNLRDYS